MFASDCPDERLGAVPLIHVSAEHTSAIVHIDAPTQVSSSHAPITPSIARARPLTRHSDLFPTSGSLPSLTQSDDIVDQLDEVGEAEEAVPIPPPGLSLAFRIVSETVGEPSGAEGVA